nr:MAG TPA: hypothetical protein [Caudoviricetes sp.]
MRSAAAVTATLLLSCGLITAVGDNGHGGITWGRDPSITHTSHTGGDSDDAHTVDEQDRD